MRRLARGLRALAFAAALTSAPLSAWAGGVDPGAATPVQREQAQARFVRGKQLFEAKKYADALQEFRASHEIVASPNTRLYLARTLRELGKIVEAYVELGRTEVEARELAREDPRYGKTGEAARAERDALKQRVGFVTVRIDHPEDTTKLVVGNEEIRREGWQEPIPAMPGTTEVRVETAGRTPVTGTVTLEAGQTKPLALDAASGAKIADAAPPSEPAPAPPPAEPEKKSLRPFAFVAGGVGVAGVATFAIFGLMAKGTHDDLASRCPNGACPNDPASDVNKGKSQQTVANIGLVVGVVGIAAGVTLFVLEPKSTAPSMSAAIGPGRLSLEGKF